MSDRAEKLRQEVVARLMTESPACPYCDTNLEPIDIRADFPHYVKAIVEGRVTWEMVDDVKMGANLLGFPGVDDSPLGPVHAFLSDMLEAAGVPRPEDGT